MMHITSSTPVCGKHSLNPLVIMALLVTATILIPLATVHGSVTHNAGRRPYGKTAAHPWRWGWVTSVQPFLCFSNYSGAAE